MFRREIRGSRLSEVKVKTFLILLVALTCTSILSAQSAEDTLKWLREFVELHHGINPDGAVFYTDEIDWDEYRCPPGSWQCGIEMQWSSVRDIKRTNNGIEIFGTTSDWFKYRNYDGTTRTGHESAPVQRWVTFKLTGEATPLDYDRMLKAMTRLAVLQGANLNKNDLF